MENKLWITPYSNRNSFCMRNNLNKFFMYFKNTLLSLICIIFFHSFKIYIIHYILVKGNTYIHYIYLKVTVHSFKHAFNFTEKKIVNISIFFLCLVFMFCNLENWQKQSGVTLLIFKIFEK